MRPRTRMMSAGPAGAAGACACATVATSATIPSARRRARPCWLRMAATIGRRLLAGGDHPAEQCALGAAEQGGIRVLPLVSEHPPHVVAGLPGAALDVGVAVGFAGEHGEVGLDAAPRDVAGAYFHRQKNI